MPFLLTLVASATAAPLAFVVEVSDPDTLLVGAPTLRVKDARGEDVAIPLHDDGVSPDPAAGDGRWSGGAEVRLVGPYTLTLRAADGGVWTSTLAADNSDEPGLSIVPRADGTVVSAQRSAKSGLIVEVSDPDTLLVGAPTLRVKDARGEDVAIPLHDDGVAPDPTSGDRRWSGGTDAHLESPYVVTLQSADGEVWRSTLAAPNPDEPGLQVAPRDGGTVVSTLGVAPTPTPPPLMGPEAPDAGRGESVQNGTLLALTWIAALGTLAWALAARLAPVPQGLPGVAPTLPGRGRTCVRGEVEALVRALARTHRVVFVGPIPALVARDEEDESGIPPRVPLPTGAFFPVGPGRVAMEDVLAVVGGLAGRGAPLVVVLAGPLESGGADGAHRAAARRLAAHLPAGVVVYDFEDGPATWGVDVEGRLAPL